MTIDRIGVHDSTGIDFPFEALEEELTGIDSEVVPVDGVEGGDDAAAVAPATCDAFVTFTHQPGLLECDPEWIHTTQAGVDGFPLAEYELHGTVLTNSTGLHGDSVGDTTVGLMLMLARRLHEFVANQGERVWQFPEWDAAFTLPGERVCVVGLGAVGSAVAKRCAALGMEVTGVRRSTEPVDGVDTLYAPDELGAAIEDARFVVLCVPLTDETRGLVGETELERMGEDAYLVNVARGAVVDQDALVAALREGAIAGAALDVFEEEPLPEDSPLWDMDDVIITPHAAVANREFYRGIADLVRENVRRFEAGEAPRNRVV
ncbi:MAG: D-2-hydroxyacid dehydrogenase [Haloarculaceae archaeon]